MSYNKPLEGIKIVEISTIVTASLATMMMADQGAEVIKIEQLMIGSVSKELRNLFFAMTDKKKNPWSSVMPRKQIAP